MLDVLLFQRETEILFFLMIVIMIRTRKTGSVTMISYLSSSFVYTKVANLILWFYADIRMGIIFAIIFICTYLFNIMSYWNELQNVIIIIVCGLVFPEPTYQGPEKVTYLRGANGLQEELHRDTRVVWLIAFYTAWNPACVNFAPIFSELSAEFVTIIYLSHKCFVGKWYLIIS